MDIGFITAMGALAVLLVAYFGGMFRQYCIDRDKPPCPVDGGTLKRVITRSTRRYDPASRDFTTLECESCEFQGFPTAEDRKQHDDYVIYVASSVPPDRIQPDRQHPPFAGGIADLDRHTDT